MQERIDIMNRIYDAFDEDVRLSRSRQGQLEFFTTTEYIRRYAGKGAKILEIGAGTGRYSVFLAKAGFSVSAVELVKKNLDVLKENAKGLANLQAWQADAVDLSRFADDTFDLTLCFPMYHLYERADVDRAIDEALRVTKKGGVVFFAFLSAYAIICNDYFGEGLRDGMRENFDDEGRVRHFKEQVFTGYDITEFEELFLQKSVTHLHTVAADTVLEGFERLGFRTTDEEFEAIKEYHLRTCEKRELLGLSSHLLYICKKF